MRAVETSQSQLLTELDKLIKRARARMTALGLTLSVWDPGGLSVGPFEPQCDLCRSLCADAAPCLGAIRDLAAEVGEGGQSAWRELPTGCCILAVPLHKRRRTIGTAVACYPTDRWLDEEFLSRRCDALRLDRAVVSRQVVRSARHSAGEVQDLLRWFEWVLEDEQALHVANGELTTLSTNLSTTYEELSLLYSISGSMRVTQRPEEFIFNVCRQVQEVMDLGAAAAVVYAHPSVAAEDLVVVAGEIALTPEQVKLMAVTQVSPLLGESHRAVVDNQFAWRDRPDLRDVVRNFVAVLLVGEGPLGMLLALNKSAGDFNSVDLKLMNSIGNQSAVFLTNNMLYADLQDLLMGVLHALSASIDAKDPYTCGHSNRVAVISRRLAQEMHLPPARVQRIYLAGLLHDIGKIGVPESTLCKPGRLTAEEYETIKKHPDIGARILGGIRQLEDVVAGILGHHERLDGKGYPHGLAGDEVTLDARILCLADCFDAMTSDRIYRKALPLETVLQEIRDHAGTQFDPDAAEKFLRLDLAAFLEELRKPAQSVLPVRIIQQEATG